jgi:hypothetical protein
MRRWWIAAAVFAAAQLVADVSVSQQSPYLEKFIATPDQTHSVDQLVEAVVPSVGCPRDGQVGPQAAPQLKNATVLVPKELASQLAYYSASAEGPGVLGPRGWSCFGTYGSAGSTLYVVPNSIIGPILERPAKIGGGPAIVVSSFVGETSGRFAMAKIAARIFPEARGFVEKVRAEGADDPAEYVFGLWPDDTITRLSDSSVSYTTPPSTVGLGTMYGPVPGSEPIRGLVFLNLSSSNHGPNLTKLSVRLPNAVNRLYPAIAMAILAVTYRDRTERAAANSSASPYPPQLLGAWGGWDTDPAVARQACESYRRNPKAVAGDLLVFQGSKKFSYGGYVDYSDQNVSVRLLAPNKWQIVDRHYHDGEGGGRAGHKNVAYEVALDGNSLTVREGKYTSRFSRCQGEQRSPSP